MPTVTHQAPKAHANPAQHSVARTGLVPPALRVARRSEQAALHRAEITQHAAVAYRPPADAHYSAADMTAYAIGRVAAAGHTPTIASSGSFSYRDAAIGAGMIAAAALLIAAGALALWGRGRLQHS